jgi:hypothetical protein
MTTRPHLLPGFIVLGLMTLTALGGLTYAWRRSRPEYFKQLTLWRRVLSGVGLLAVSFQAFLFLLFWTRIGRDPVLIAHWARWVDPPFLLAVPCILAGKGAFRWSLLSASILLFAICFLLTLSA